MAINILLVDDDPVQGATRKTILERAGFLVRVASDGAQALAFLNSPQGNAVRMVITDHLMPAMNGPELVRALRRSGFHFPVLALSGYAYAEEEYRGLDVVFRLKPFPPDQLIALVQFLLAEAERLTA